MKFVYVFLILVAALLSCNALNKASKNTVQQISQISKRVLKAIPLKGKTLPLQKSQAKVERPKQNKASNAKRWMPAKKNNVKYVAKIENNKKRWMPAFAEMTQNDMESSMMFDTGFVSSDPRSSFQEAQQQHAGEFGLPQPETAQQGLPPEQSFLTPGNTDQDIGLPGQAVAGRTQDNQFQTYGNEIESFTKEGLDGGTNSMFNNFDGFQESALNNPKYQEGDFIGGPTIDSSEGKQANLYDAFTLAPGMAENFVNPLKENNGGSKVSGDGKKDKSKDEKKKNAEKENTKKEEEEEKSNKKEEKEKSKKEEEKAKEKKTESKEGKKGESSAKSEAKAISGDQKENVESEDTKEANNDEESGKEATGQGDKLENAEKEQKDEKVKGKEGKAKSLAAKEKNVSETKSKEASEKDDSQEKEVANKDSEKDDNEQNDKANLANSENESAQVEKEEGKGKDETNEKEDAEDNSKQKESKNHKVNKKIKNVQKVTKHIEKFFKEANAAEPNIEQGKNSKSGDEVDDGQQPKRVSKSKEKQEMKSSQKEEEEQLTNSQNKMQKQSQASENKEREQNAANSKQDSKGVINIEDESRIKKLKQRINTQKIKKTRGRLQQDAAERQKITPDNGGAMIDSSLASNVSPANARLGLAAEGLRKQLVSNLRHALMRNVAAAIAKGTTTNLQEENIGGQSQGVMQNLQPQGNDGGSAAIKQESQQGNEKPNSSNGQSSFQNGGQKNTQENEAGAKEDANQASGSQDANGGSDQSLVPTLMKMDKPMLINTILKLMKKNQGKSNENGEKEAMEKNEKEEKESKDGGAINQSFSNQAETASDVATASDGAASHAVDQEAEAKDTDNAANVDKESQAASAGETKVEAKNPKIASGTQEENGHSEYATVPIKSSGDTKFYKFKKLQGQGHIKGKLAHLREGDDPYAQIGLVDPANNDKMPTHHKASTLKEDMESQQAKVSKFVKGGDDGGKEMTDSNVDNSEQSKEASGQNQESLNQESNESNQRSEQGSANGQEAEKQSDGDQAQGQAIQDQQSSNDNGDQSGNQGGNQVGNQEVTTNHKTDQDAPIQQTQVQQQPDGVTTVTNINADTPKMVAQLMKISQRLHEINDKKGEQSQQKVNDDQSKTISNIYSDAGIPQKSHDDAYASIGSFDPNVKKKAAIGKKKTIMNKQFANKQSTSNDNIISKRRI